MPITIRLAPRFRVYCGAELILKTNNAAAVFDLCEEARLARKKGKLVPALRIEYREREAA